MLRSGGLEYLDQWAHAARAGDEAALDRLVTALYPQVHLLAVAVVGPVAAVRVAEETFLRVVASLPKFWGKAEARTWVLALARQASLDELRDRSDDGGPDAPHPVVDPEAAASADPAGDGAGAGARPPGLAQLDTELAVVFALTQLLGLSYQEAGTVTGTPAALIRLQVMDAREALLGGPVGLG